MRRREHKMPRAVDKRAFLYSIRPPEHKHQMLSIFSKVADDGISENFPSFPLMRAGAMCAHREGGVEEQHSLFCPTCEVAGSGYFGAYVVMNFFKNIL